MCGSGQRGGWPRGARAAGRARRAGRGKAPRAQARCSRGTQPSWRLLPGLWSDPQRPQLGGHRDSWSLRAALGSWKSPRQDEEPVSALSLHDVRSAYLAPGIPPVRGTAAVAADRPSVSPGGLLCLSEDPCSPVGASAGVVGPSVGCSWDTCLPAKLAAGQEPDRDAGVPLTRGATGAGEDSTEACHSAGHLGPRSWLWRWGRKGPRWAEAAWPRRQGAPQCAVSPGRERCWVPPPGGPAPRRVMGPCSLPGGPACGASPATRVPLRELSRVSGTWGQWWFLIVKSSSDPCDPSSRPTDCHHLRVLLCLAGPVCPPPEQSRHRSLLAPL